jgi:membrane protein implicated in regulation of membrane protease activity
MAAPSRKDRTRPAELLALAGGLAIFVGLIVLLATRAPFQAVVSLGVVFIVSLVVLAMLSLAARPSTEDPDKDIKDSTESGE